MSEINTDNALLNELLHSLDCGGLKLVRFQSVDEIDDFVGAVKKAFSNEDYEEKPSNVYFIAETKEFPTQNNQSIETIVHQLPSTVYFSNQNEIIRFAAAYSSRTEVSKNESSPEEKGETDTKTITDVAYSTDYKAEKIMNSLAELTRIAGWVIGVFHFIVAIVTAVLSDIDGGILFVLLGAILCAIYVLLGYIFWAMLKVVVNMSNNLYNINQQLKK